MSSHRRFGKSRRLFRHHSRLFSGTRCFSRHLPPPSTRSPTKWSTSSQMSFTRSLCPSNVLVVHQSWSRSGFPTRRSLESGNVAGLWGSRSPRGVKVIVSATGVPVVAQTYSSTSYGVLLQTAQWMHHHGTTMESRKGTPSLLWPWLNKNRCREPDSVHEFFRFFSSPRSAPSKIPLIAKSHPSFNLSIFQIFHSLALHLIHFLLSHQLRFLNSSTSLPVVIFNGLHLHISD